MYFPCMPHIWLPLITELFFVEFRLDKIVLTFIQFLLKKKYCGLDGMRRGSSADNPLLFWYCTSLSSQRTTYD